MPDEYINDYQYYYALALTTSRVPKGKSHDFFDAFARNAIPKSKANCYIIYRKNTAKVRKQFFSDKFIQILWKKYTINYKECIMTYLQ